MRAIYPGRPKSKKLPGLSLYLTITVLSLGLMLMLPRADAQDNNPSSGQPQSVPVPANEDASQAAVLLQLQAAVRANPKKAADLVTRALENEQNTITFAAQAVAASIRGLGQKANRVSVGRIILAAVKARPAAVLEIVRVTIHQTKKEVHREIVAASASGIAAVSDPYMRVSVVLVENGALGYEPYSSTASDGPIQVVAGFKFEQGATLADEIVQVAFQSESHGSLAEVSNSLNPVLQRQTTADPFANLGQLPNNLSVFEPTPTPSIGRTPLAEPAPVSP